METYFLLGVLLLLLGYIIHLKIKYYRTVDALITGGKDLMKEYKKLKHRVSYYENKELDELLNGL